MATTQRSTVVGVFEDRRDADKAVAALKAAGFRDDQIGVAMRHSDGATDATAKGEDTYAEEGATTGLLAGLGLGALAGMGVLAGVIPVIGPAIAGGTLGILLSNAAAGAAVASLAGALIGYGIPEDEAKYYHSEFEAGRTIVTVQAAGRYDEANQILHRFSGYDMTSRGTSVGAAAARPAASATGSSTASHAVGSTVGSPVGTTADRSTTTGRAGDTIQVKEERLHAEKRPVETGEVTVRKEVHTETKHIDVPVEREEIVIERTPVHGRAAATTDTIREGQEIRIPVREEQVSVTKDAVVTEEVKVGKRVVHDTEHVTGQVRKEEVKVEQTGDVDVRTRNDKTSK